MTTKPLGLAALPPAAAIFTAQYVLPLLTSNLLYMWPFVLFVGGISIAALCLYYFHLQMETVQPTSENLAEDISRPLPWPLRLIGFCLDMLPMTLWDVSDADALLQQGAADAGLSQDGYSPLVVEAIHKLCDSLKSDKAKPNWAGRKNIHFVVTSGLTQYLLIHQFAKENPQVASSKLNRPLIVTGLTRSGTTHLHRLMSEVVADGMPVPLWQQFFPVVPPFLSGIWAILFGDLRPVYVWVFLYVWKFITNIYGFDSMHFMRPNLPDECHISIRMGGATLLAFWAMAPVHTYMNWYLDSEAAKAHIQHGYETYRLALQMAQCENPNRRFVLKCPGHSFNLAILREVIPEAAVVVTHRDPCKASLSWCSMAVRMKAAGCDGFDWRQCIQQDIKMQATFAEALMAYCRDNKDRNIYHVSYIQLVSEPIKLVQNVCDVLQIPLVQDMESKLQAYVDKNEQHSHGIHRYSYEGMELKQQDLAKPFSTYIAFFQQYL